MAWIVLVSLLVSAVLVPEAYGDGVMITSFDSDPSTVEDTANTAETINLNCEVNLPSANITSVTLTHPDGTTTGMTPNTDMSNLMLYRTVINDVHPSHSGTYVCTVVDTSVPQISVTKNYDLTISCSDGYYGPTCSSQCSCVSVATCDATTGVCTNCPVTAEIVCRKGDIMVTTFNSSPLNQVTDVTDAVQDVTLHCTVNLPAADITSVEITGPNYMKTFSSPLQSNIIDTTLSNVGPPNSGTYTCRASTDVSSHSKNYMLSVDCRQGYYGVGCSSRCTCVSDGSCNDVNGTCSCTPAFTGATCDKKSITITSFQPMSNDPVVRDDDNPNDVIMRCHVNLAQSEIQGVTVDLLSPDTQKAMTMVLGEPGVWEYTLIDVHPENSGLYVCRVTAQPTADNTIYRDSNTYDLTVIDVDECLENMDNCHANATCTNKNGTFVCTCKDGFSGSGVQCDDIDECADINKNNCHNDATCNNTIGSFYCVCNDGFSGNGITCQMCTPVNYGSNCMEVCSCVEQVPGQNDVTCNHVNGLCTCNIEFLGKECDKAKLAPKLVPDPFPVLDRSGLDNVTWRCDIKLHSRDLSGNVTITYPNGSKYPTTMNGEGLYELVLNDVTPNNNGLYRCEATANGMMPQSGEFLLDVLIVGRIISVSPPVEGQVGTTVEVNCTVYASQGANITWFSVSDEDTPIENDDKYNIMRSGEEFEQTSTLRVSNLDPNTDNGTYICKATEDRKEVEIIVIEAPIIKGITVTTKSKQELQVSWAIDFNGNVPLYECMVNYSDTQIGQGVQAPGSLNNAVSHVIMGLNPYTWYYVNVQCKNKVGVSNVLPGGPQRTNQSEPSQPLRPAERNVQKKSFEVIWEEPDMKNGPISFYTVTIKKDANEIRKSNTALMFISVDGLSPYTEYNVEVTASNMQFGDELRGTPSSITITTLEDAPTAPVNVQSINNLDTCEVTWEKPLQTNGIIKSYEIIYSAYPRDGSEKDDANSDSKTITDGTQTSYSFIKQKFAYFTEYQFVVTAKTTEVGDPSEISNGTCTTDSTAPPPPPTPQEGKPPNSDEEAITSSTFYMTLMQASSRNGNISCYHIIVKELAEDENFDDLDPAAYPPENVVSYRDALDKPRTPYRAIVIAGSDVGKEDLKIGAEGASTCKEKSSRRKKRATIYEHSGNNGGLQSNTRYTTFVQAFVKVGDGEVYTSSPFMKPVTTGKGTNSAAIIIGVLLAILCIIVIVLIGLIFMRRHKQTPLLHEGENGVALESLKAEESEVTHMVVPPIPLEDLPAKFKVKSENDDEIFKNEYKSIPESTGTITKNASRQECNKEKNRYINITAFDQSRVKITTIEGEEGSDYINACFVDGYERPRKFIAAQGPRDDTVLDFWRMIWEKNCSTLIMLTKCVENGREKCAEYWPEEDAIMYGDIIVTLDDVVTCADYLIRKFTVQKSIEGENEDEEPIISETRTMMQFHFLGWPDFGIPKYPHSMLCFIKRIRHMTGNRTEPGNIVIHCSAGVGRTGTYILIDTMLDMMKKEKRVDIYNVIYELRSQRNLIVQSLVQYIFIHKALMEEYLYGHTEVDVGGLQSYYQKITKKTESDVTGIETEYRTVASLPVEDTDQKTGNIEANKQKNRLRQVIPYDKNRVKLERLTGQEHSNYINASFIDGYEHKKAYIAAQGPLPNTMGDFWRLIWENQCSTVVMLTECEERGQTVCSKYWPNSDETVNHAFLTVSLKEEKESTDEYTIRDLEVSTTKGAGTKLIRQYHFHDWPEVGTPEGAASLVKIIGLAHDYQSDIGRFPVLVHCSAGSGRTGVFIALSYLLQRAKAEGLVDVFQAVRTLRQQRPHMVQDVEQYQFCYRAMMEYLDSFDHYANFK